ncbi:unnamed protein product [Adineta ricciae]|uniref:Uncharacterized protein n=1 Tax=Adineta ricciae TaxID=249248 RepID=A0A815F6V5_ADIRI|nr:unnamed protein product [Adineta ricciae]
MSMIIYGTSWLNEWMRDVRFKFIVYPQSPSTSVQFEHETTFISKFTYGSSIVGTQKQDMSFCSTQQGVSNEPNGWLSKIICREDLIALRQVHGNATGPYIKASRPS